MGRCLSLVVLCGVSALSFHPSHARANDRSDTRGAGTESPALGVPLLAHWTFDEPTGGVIHEASGKTAFDVTAEVPRSRGVHGQALGLSGGHQLLVGPLPAAGILQQIAFAAWVKPTDLSGFREIFRQECPERLLFSFQNSGTVLSLGLNIGGYIECDAAINPAQVLDGAWHHAAATFDGQVMRVYLDGDEIGSLERTGPITANTQAPAFIGSSGGAGEHFQGGLDDLRIYGQALTPGQVQQLYREGISSVAARLQELETKGRALYQLQTTFADTLASFRKVLANQAEPLDTELIGVLLARLKADFPADYADYVGTTGGSPYEYLMANNNDALTAMVGQLVELMLEYRPLTEQQCQRLTDVEEQHWKEVDSIARSFEQLKAGPVADADSPAWIEIMLAAARRVQLRPAVSEAVAPYRKPETPATRDLSAGEALDALRRDWLHQADGNPTKARILAEIQWTQQLAERIAGDGEAPVDLTRELVALNKLQVQAQQAGDGDVELYFRVRQLKRSLVFKNPAVDFDRVLFVDMPFPQGSEWPHETRHRLGYMAVPGGRLMVLEGLSPAGHLRQLMPQSPLHGSFWRPDLSFDGGKVLFCFKPHNEKAFHLYEINLDGTDLVQLTDGPYDDLDPDLPARRRTRDLLHDTRTHLCAVHAADQCLCPGALRCRRPEHLPDLAQQRT